MKNKLLFVITLIALTSYACKPKTQTETSQEQQEDLNHALEQAAKAAKFSIKHSFSDTMNRYNKK